MSIAGLFEGERPVTNMNAGLELEGTGPILTADDDTVISPLSALAP